MGGTLHSGVPQFTTNFGGANTMAQKVVGLIKLQIPAGKATPAPPVGPALGQHGVNIVLSESRANRGGRGRLTGRGLKFN